jgi:hypothetical protein
MRTIAGSISANTLAQGALADEHFTVGDLNVASVLSPSRATHLEMPSLGGFEKGLVTNEPSDCYPETDLQERRYAAPEEVRPFIGGRSDFDVRAQTS